MLYPNPIYIYTIFPPLSHISSPFYLSTCLLAIFYFYFPKSRQATQLTGSVSEGSSVRTIFTFVQCIVYSLVFNWDKCFVKSFIYTITKFVTSIKFCVNLPQWVFFKLMVFVNQNRMRHLYLFEGMCKYI